MLFQNQQKHTKKVEVLRVASSIRKVFPSLDIYYNNCLNTEVQKENESKSC